MSVLLIAVIVAMSLLFVLIFIITIMATVCDKKKKKDSFENIPYHDRVFDTENRIKYCSGPNVDTAIVEMYNNEDVPDNHYIVDKEFVGGFDPSSDASRGDAWIIYMTEMKNLFSAFVTAHPRHAASKVIMVPGDVSHPFKVPIVCKTRPIANPGHNSLLPLNTERHWGEIKNLRANDIPFDEKKNGLVWRGAMTGKNKREPLMNWWFPRKLVNIAFVHNTINRMTLKELLQYKYILSVEGNDVASNLKWIMASNSLCIMPKPTMESWFMEGKLVAGEHYVQVNDDFSDLIEVVKWCIAHPVTVKRIIAKANDYVSRFDNKNNEAVSNGVLINYVKRTNVLQ